MDPTFTSRVFNKGQQASSNMSGTATDPLDVVVYPEDEYTYENIENSDPSSISQDPQDRYSQSGSDYEWEPDEFDEENFYENIGDRRDYQINEGDGDTVYELYQDESTHKQKLQKMKIQRDRLLSQKANIQSNFDETRDELLKTQSIQDDLKKKQKSSLSNKFVSKIPGSELSEKKNHLKMEISDLTKKLHALSHNISMLDDRIAFMNNYISRIEHVIKQMYEDDKNCKMLKRRREEELDKIKLDQEAEIRTAFQNECSDKYQEWFSNITEASRLIETKQRDFQNQQTAFNISYRHSNALIQTLQKRIEQEQKRIQDEKSNLDIRKAQTDNDIQNLRQTIQTGKQSIERIDQEVPPEWRPDDKYYELSSTIEALDMNASVAKIKLETNVADIFSEYERMDQINLGSNIQDDKGTNMHTTESKKASIGTHLHNLMKRDGSKSRTSSPSKH